MARPCIRAKWRRRVLRMAQGVASLTAMGIVPSLRIRLASFWENVNAMFTFDIEPFSTVSWNSAHEPRWPHVSRSYPITRGKAVWSSGLTRVATTRRRLSANGAEPLDAFGYFIGLFYIPSGGQYIPFRSMVQYVHNFREIAINR
jgi:hypothetical protein